MAVTSKPDDDGAECRTKINRRTYLGLVALGVLNFSLSDALFGPDPAKIAIDEADDRDEYDEDRFDLFVAEDTGAMYVADEDEGGWKILEATGLSPKLESLIVTDLRTKKIGVSAAVGTDQTVSTGTEKKLAIDKTSDPYFDDSTSLMTTRTRSSSSMTRTMRSSPMPILGRLQQPET